MRWKLPWPKPAALKLAASGAGDDEQPDGWQRHIEALRQAGIPEPGSAVRGRKPATEADEQALYLRRQPRLPEEQALHAVHFLASSEGADLQVQPCADRAAWLGRHGSPARPLGADDLYGPGAHGRKG